MTTAEFVQLYERGVCLVLIERDKEGDFTNYYFSTIY